MHAPHSYCHACGVAYPADRGWPRTCTHCAHLTYRNPTPVAVVLQPVGSGLLLVRRGQGQWAGQLALPGGYLEAGETWAEGAARELWEETGARVDPAGLRACGVYSASDDSLLIFALAPPLLLYDLTAFDPTPETTACLVAEAPLTLAFRSHTAMMARYFAGTLTTLDGL